MLGKIYRNRKNQFLDLMENAVQVAEDCLEVIESKEDEIKRDNSLSTDMKNYYLSACKGQRLLVGIGLPFLCVMQNVVRNDYMNTLKATLDSPSLLPALTYNEIYYLFIEMRDDELHCCLESMKLNSNEYNEILNALHNQDVCAFEEALYATQQDFTEITKKFASYAFLKGINKGSDIEHLSTNFADVEGMFNDCVFLINQHYPAGTENKIAGESILPKLRESFDVWGRLSYMIDYNDFTARDEVVLALENGMSTNLPWKTIRNLFIDIMFIYENYFIQLEFTEEFVNMLEECFERQPDLYTIPKQVEYAFKRASQIMLEKLQSDNNTEFVIPDDFFANPQNYTRLQEGSCLYSKKHRREVSPKALTDFINKLAENEFIENDYNVKVTLLGRLIGYTIAEINDDLVIEWSNGQENCLFNLVKCFYREKNDGSILPANTYSRMERFFKFTKKESKKPNYSGLADNISNPHYIKFWKELTGEDIPY